MLLFLVGLKLDVRVIRDTGRVALISGAVQIGLTAASASAWRCYSARRS